MKKTQFVVTADKGYTLIEVLVALLVISLGLLGMAALQITALKQNQNAYVRSQAVIAANDIMDRMRANSTAVANGNYFSDNAGYDGDSADTSCEGSVCTVTAMASYDLNNWKYTLQQEMPSGGGCITRIKEDRIGFQVEETSDLEALCTEGNDTDLPVVIYVWWNDARFQNEVQSVETDADWQVITLSADI
ncbi:type IV pilus modification protein PilV [Pontibacterium granulatum]|uniref:type IV pilus modification protein PilV n=1 Tax=Pontibacterium granulatum TaxID=2036029 RepID=UPI00249B44C7|nr:type IV pilus modification protein PilV [Pontibacterium granulatum]MDI3325245.1 type IV pilus modification protein PilV [Pontibacterium granulatum]